MSFRNINREEILSALDSIRSTKSFAEQGREVTLEYNLKGKKFRGGDLKSILDCFQNVGGVSDVYLDLSVNWFDDKAADIFIKQAADISHPFSPRIHLDLSGNYFTSDVQGKLADALAKLGCQDVDFGTQKQSIVSDSMHQLLKELKEAGCEVDISEQDDRENGAKVEAFKIHDKSIGNTVLGTFRRPFVLPQAVDSTSAPVPTLSGRT